MTNKESNIHTIFSYKLKGSVFFIEKLEQINAEGMTELENHHLATTNEKKINLISNKWMHLTNQL